MLILVRLIAVGAAVLVLLQPRSSASASGEPVCTAPAQITISASGYSCTVPGQPGGAGASGTSTGGTQGGQGGPAGPTCTLYADYDYCIGASPCVDVEWRPPMALPEGPKPQPTSEPRARRCGFADPQTEGPIGLTYYWSDSGEPQPPSLAEQAQTAVGQLDLRAPAVRTSPPGRTLVNLPTWFWVEGASTTVTGSSAFGLVAIATVRELRVDPGDGSGAFRCPWTTSEAQAEKSCSHTYVRASDDGSALSDGRPAHEVSAHAVWDVRFEVDGTPVTGIPGAPELLDGPVGTAALRVDEVQSVVQDID